jgi:hypothetical protein
MSTSRADHQSLPKNSSYAMPYHFEGVKPSHGRDDIQEDTSSLPIHKSLIGTLTFIPENSFTTMTRMYMSKDVESGFNKPNFFE